MFKKLACLSVILSFFLSILGPIPQAHADSILNLPAPGVMVNMSPRFEPALIRGLIVHRDNPFLFDFIVDPGKSKVSPQALKDESDRMIKYFFASLTIPDQDVWVNLSPYEKDRMIPQALGETAMGRDLLDQDYMLKQLTASLIYPQSALGKTFWDQVYSKAKEMYGTTQIPINTFNKVWIVPQRVGIYEHNQTAFIVDGHLKVMLEEDYLSLTKHNAISNTGAKQSHTIASQIVRQIVLPEIEKEINDGKNFATLRQIFYAQALAVWFKQNLKQALLNRVYADKGTVKGIDQNNEATNEAIYQQYLKAYKKGVFNYVKEDIDPITQETLPRKYFSGGYREEDIERAFEPYSFSRSKDGMMQADKDGAMVVNVFAGNPLMKGLGLLAASLAPTSAVNLNTSPLEQRLVSSYVQNIHIEPTVHGGSKVTLNGPSLNAQILQGTGIEPYSPHLTPADIAKQEFVVKTMTGVSVNVLPDGTVSLQTSLSPAQVNTMMNSNPESLATAASIMAGGVMADLVGKDLAVEDQTTKGQTFSDTTALALAFMVHDFGREQKSNGSSDEASLADAWQAVVHYQSLLNVHLGGVLLLAVGIALGKRFLSQARSAKDIKTVRKMIKFLKIPVDGIAAMIFAVTGFALSDKAKLNLGNIPHDILSGTTGAMAAGGIGGMTITMLPEWEKAANNAKDVNDPYLRALLGFYGNKYRKTFLDAFWPVYVVLAYEGFFKISIPGLSDLLDLLVKNSSPAWQNFEFLLPFTSSILFTVFYLNKISQSPQFVKQLGKTPFIPEIKTTEDVHKDFGRSELLMQFIDAISLSSEQLDSRWARLNNTSKMIENERELQEQDLRYVVAALEDGAGRPEYSKLEARKPLLEALDRLRVSNIREQLGSLRDLLGQLNTQAVAAALAGDFSMTVKIKSPNTAAQALTVLSNVIAAKEHSLIQVPEVSENKEQGGNSSSENPIEKPPVMATGEGQNLQTDQPVAQPVGQAKRSFVSRIPLLGPAIDKRTANKYKKDGAMSVPSNYSVYTVTEDGTYIIAGHRVNIDVNEGTIRWLEENETTELQLDGHNGIAYPKGGSLPDVIFGPVDGSMTAGMPLVERLVKGKSVLVALAVLGLASFSSNVQAQQNYHYGNPIRTVQDVMAVKGELQFLVNIGQKREVAGDIKGARVNFQEIKDEARADLENVRKNFTGPKAVTAAVIEELRADVQEGEYKLLEADLNEGINAEAPVEAAAAKKVSQGAEFLLERAGADAIKGSFEGTNLRVTFTNLRDMAKIYVPTEKDPSKDSIKTYGDYRAVENVYITNALAHAKELLKTDVHAGYLALRAVEKEANKRAKEARLDKLNFSAVADFTINKKPVTPADIFDLDADDSRTAWSKFLADELNQFKSSAAQATTSEEKQGILNQINELHLDDPEVQRGVSQKTLDGFKKLKDSLEQSSSNPTNSALRGGIDLSQQDAAMHITRDANGGVKVDVDPVEIARVERDGLSEVDPIIIGMHRENIVSVFGIN